eukprot:SAG31_NODE_2570_length_5460_cov_3.135236_3_plen_1561_part_00
MSEFDGGIRVAGLVAGGFWEAHSTLPAGMILSGLMHVADILATVCAASGLEPPDQSEMAAALPALDSLSMWAYLTGASAYSPRTELQVSQHTLIQWVNGSNVSDQKLLKLITGDVPYGCWSGPNYPGDGTPTQCGSVLHCAEGCLFDVQRDIAERYPISNDTATKATMAARLAELNTHRWEPLRGPPDPAACTAARDYGNVVGPWLGCLLPPAPAPTPSPTTGNWSSGIVGKFFEQCPDVQNVPNQTLAQCMAACDKHSGCNTININHRHSGINAGACALRACPCDHMESPQGVSANVTAYRRNDRNCRPCSTDMDCPYDGAFRCCGLTGDTENCPKAPAGGGGHGAGECTLPGTIGKSHCGCKRMHCSVTAHTSIPGKKQWLMIGDSISDGCYGPAQQLAAAHNLQITHNPTNAANVWWGAHCLDGWIGNGHWDIITFQFGLHDLALDNERIEPEIYGRWLANITQRVAAAAPKAALIWVTTTPVPLGIDGFCNKSTGEGGCPPRNNADPPVYNAAAAKAIRAVPAAARIKTLDLYSVVTKKCGAKYTLCPEGCSASKVKGAWEGNCFQIPHNVHYLTEGWHVLAAAYVDAVIKAVTIQVDRPPAAYSSSRYQEAPSMNDAMTMKTDDGVLLESSLLRVWLAADSPRILNYTYSPTSYTFAGATHGGEGFRPVVSINGGAVTCGQFGFRTRYNRTSTIATDFQLTMRCAYNYATLPKLARSRDQTGPVTVILTGAVRILPPSLKDTRSEAGTVCANRSVYCPVLADCYQNCQDEHHAPGCYQNPCCPSRSFGDYNISSLGFYECTSTPCLANCTKSLAPAKPPPPHLAPPATVEWAITAVSSDEVSVPVRDIDLIGFEFLTLRGWSTELGTNSAYVPTFSTSEPCFGAIKTYCGGKNEAQQCSMCYAEHRADIDPHCGNLPAEAAYNYTGAIIEMLPHACGMPRTGCFYTPDDFPSTQGPVCTGIGETYWVDDWHRERNGNGMEMTADTKTGKLDANSVCLDGARSRQNSGPIQSIQAGGWSADQRTGAALMSSQHHLPFNAGPKSFDAPERCQIFTVSSATIKARVRCGSSLPFSVKVGFFGDLNKDGSVDDRDIALWRRSQIPDADPQYFGNMVYKLGLDYTSDYPPSHNWTRVPFLPPSEMVGSPSLPRMPYEGYSALEWIANMSLIADGMPQTPILFGWQRDASWWLFGAVNDQLGGEPALRKLCGLAKQRHTATLSYHINTLESFAVIGDGKPPNTAWSSPQASPEFDSHSQCKRNIDHHSGWEAWSQAWMRWPFAGPDCHVSATRESFRGNRSSRIGALFDHVPIVAGGTVHIDAWRDNGRSYEPLDEDSGWGWIGESEENICAMVRDFEIFASRGISVGTEGPNGVATQWLGLISFFWHGTGGEPSSLRADETGMFSPATWGKIISNSEMGLDNDMSPNKCACPNVVACNCLHGFENIADRVYWKLRLIQLALTDELLTVNGDHLHFAQGGRLRIQHLLVLPDEYELGQHTSMKGDASRYAIHPSAKGTAPSTWPFGGASFHQKNSVIPTALIHQNKVQQCRIVLLMTGLCL